MFKSPPWFGMRQLRAPWFGRELLAIERTHKQMCRPTCHIEEQLTTSAADVASQQTNSKLARVVLHVAATIKKLQKFWLPLVWELTR